MLSFSRSARASPPCTSFQLKEEADELESLDHDLALREDIERLWHDPQYRSEYIGNAAATVRFVDAPGDRGTEIHVELGKTAPAGKLDEAALKLVGKEPLAKVKDELRHFKQRVETVVIARSDAVPEGEQLERKRGQRPAQPLSQDELQEVGA